MSCGSMLAGPASRELSASHPRVLASGTWRAEPRRQDVAEEGALEGGSPAACSPSGRSEDVRVVDIIHMVQEVVLASRREKYKAKMHPHNKNIWSAPTAPTRSMGCLVAHRNQSSRAGTHASMTKDRERNDTALMPYGSGATRFLS